MITRRLLLRSAAIAAPALILPSRKLLARSMHGTGSGGGGYAAKAVHFDGSTWLTINSLSGVADSPFISSSAWVKYPNQSAGDTSINLYDFDPASGEAPATFLNNNGLYITFFGYNGTTYTGLASDPLEIGSIDFSVWNNYKFSADLNHADQNSMIVQLWVNDAELEVYPIANHAGPIVNKMSGISFAMPDTTADQSVIIADMADHCIAPGQFIDWSDVTNRRKFISASGKPVNPSSFPASAVLFSGDSTTFGLNQSTRSPFTLTRTPNHTSNNPSDCG